jgi:hypothetical protein
MVAMMYSVPVISNNGSLPFEEGKDKTKFPG